MVADLKKSVEATTACIVDMVASQTAMREEMADFRTAQRSAELRREARLAPSRHKAKVWVP